MPKVEMSDSYKRSSLPRFIINYGRKMFYSASHKDENLAEQAEEKTKNTKKMTKRVGQRRVRKNISSTKMLFVGQSTHL